jgi:hypothetical protein
MSFCIIESIVAEHEQSNMSVVRAVLVHIYVYVYSLYFFVWQWLVDLIFLPYIISYIFLNI